jgi:hypothetical protein
MDLVQPGINVVHRRRPDADSAACSDAEVGIHGLIARKP